MGCFQINIPDSRPPCRHDIFLPPCSSLACPIPQRFPASPIGLQGSVRMQLHLICRQESSISLGGRGCHRVKISADIRFCPLPIGCDQEILAPVFPMPRHLSPAVAGGPAVLIIQAAEQVLFLCQGCRLLHTFHIFRPHILCIQADSCMNIKTTHPHLTELFDLPFQTVHIQLRIP